MQTYYQTSGLYQIDPCVRAHGYSGHGPGLNNPAMEADPNIGPIPAGAWHIGAAADHPRLGPCAMRLTPVGHDAHGRTGFFIHGDNADGNQSASHGCIILAYAMRQAIDARPDRALEVVAQ